MMGVALRGLSIGVVLVAILAALQLYDFGLENEWAFSSVGALFASIDWPSQWRKITIIFVESAAAAAAITIGLSVVVNNIFTTNISNQIINNVTDAINQKYVDAITELKRVQEEQGVRVAAFSEKLEGNRIADIKALQEFLDYAATQQTANLRRRLSDDDELFIRLVKALSAAVEDVNRSRPSSKPPQEEAA
jgi:hypothetical protein